MGKLRFPLFPKRYSLFLLAIALVLIFMEAQSFYYPEVALLPYYTFRSLLRLTAAYIISLVFGVFFGIVCGTKKAIGNLLNPVFDVLQSVPVLGFLPAAVLFFVYSFPGEIGLELSSIFLISIGMVFPILFAVIVQIKNMRYDLKEASRVFQIKGLRNWRKVLLPAVYPNVLSASELAWGAGWYFLIACEYIKYGDVNYTLPGLGYFLAVATGKYNSLALSIFTLLFIALIVGSINRLVWARLSSNAKRYKYPSLPLGMPRGLLRIEDRLEQRVKGVYRNLVLNERQYVESKKNRWGQLRKHAFQLSDITRVTGGGHLLYVFIMSFGFFIVLYGFIFIIAGFLFVPIDYSSPAIIQIREELLNVPSYLVASLSRIAIAYLVSFAIAISIGLVFLKYVSLRKVLLPVFDVVQSIPAIAYFPVFVLLLNGLFGEGRLALELSSVLLLISGMLWFLVFNIANAIEQFPDEIEQVTRVFKLNRLKFFFRVFLPALYPALITGSLLAFGGGWSATIISEYYTFGERTYTIPGLGYLLDKAAWEYGNLFLIAVDIIIMSITVVFMNKVIWKYLLEKTKEFSFED